MKIKLVIMDGNSDWLNDMVEFLKLQGDMIITGTAMNKEDGINLARTRATDVIVMDVNLSGNKYDGIYCAAEISQFSKAKIIMVSDLKEEAVIIQSFSAGAVNYILKENFLDIPKAIRSIYYSISPMEILARSFARLKEERLLDLLTPSEKEVFGYICSGYNLPQIAQRQFKSIRTLKCQVNKILKKFGVRNSKEAIRKVRLRGWDKGLGYSKSELRIVQNGLWDMTRR